MALFSMLVKSQGIWDRENFRVEVVLVMDREISRTVLADAIRGLKQLQKS